MEVLGDEREGKGKGGRPQRSESCGMMLCNGKCTYTGIYSLAEPLIRPPVNSILGHGNWIVHWECPSPASKRLCLPGGLTSISGSHRQVCPESGSKLPFPRGLEWSRQVRVCWNLELSRFGRLFMQLCVSYHKARFPVGDPLQAVGNEYVVNASTIRFVVVDEMMTPRRPRTDSETEGSGGLLPPSHIADPKAKYSNEPDRALKAYLQQGSHSKPLRSCRRHSAPGKDVAAGQATR